MAVIAPPLRTVEMTDLTAILEIEQAIFPAPWTEAMLREEFEAPGRSYVAAVDGAAVVGYGGVMVVAGDAHIMTVAVVGSHRRKGVASRIVLALITEALRLGAAHLTLEVRVSNGPARALYEKFGFVPVGIRPAYYRDEDALVMWALDADGAAYGQLLDRIREEAT